MESTQTLRKIYYNHSIDKGCEIATNYIKAESVCIECPFEACIKDIKYSTRVLLQNHKTIAQVLEAHQQGIPLDKLTKIFNQIPTTTLRYWITHKKRIQKLIKKYTWAIPYLN